MTTHTDIRPFQIDIPQTDLDDLRNRLANTRWPRQLTDVGWTRGVPVDYLKRVAEYWQNDYDWRKHEAALNEFAQFTTEIDGEDIHFLHVRSPEPTAQPMLLVHGWPSSFTEFLKVIGPLTDPVAHGGQAEDAFHLVIPSIPGYGFSPVRQTGWGDLFRVAGAFAEVMTRLGYERFTAQGTDVGAGIVGMLGLIAAHRVVATHINGPGPFPLGPPLELDGLSGSDRDRAERFNRFRQDGAGYLHIQATRPQTLAYGLNDSPVAQLAWIIEKFKEWTDPSADLPEDAVDLDQLLTNVSIYWFNGVGASAAHSVYEGMLAYRKFAEEAAAAAGAENATSDWSGGESSNGAQVGDSGREADRDAAEGWEAPPPPPTAVAVFAADFSIRSVIDPANTYQRWSEYDRGGHFPAMEAPDLLIEDLRAFFRDHRS